MLQTKHMNKLPTLRRRLDIVSEIPFL